jgi:hypothetical protein
MKNMRQHSIVTLTLVLFVSALVAVAMAADPSLGTWTLNLAKSKFSPGEAPKSETYKKTQEKGMFKLVFDGITPDGKPYHIECTYNYDGKDYPLKGDVYVDAIAPKKIDSNTFAEVAKKGGIDVGGAREVFSRDGKTLTRTTNLRNAQGKEIINVYVYDRQ